MDAVSWAEIVSPIVSACGVIAVLIWSSIDRRRADERATEDRWEAYRRATEDRFQAHKAEAVRHDVDVAIRIALAFERHQAGDALAAAECRALLLGVTGWLPVTRQIYLGDLGQQPDDVSRIEAATSFYGMGVGTELARIEIRQQIQGQQFALYNPDSGADMPDAPKSWTAATRPPLRQRIWASVSSFVMPTFARRRDSRSNPAA